MRKLLKRQRAIIVVSYVILIGILTGVFADITPANTTMAEPVLSNNYSNNYYLLTEKDISTSYPQVQKGRIFTIYATLRNPYDSTITGNLSLLVPSYFEINGSSNKPFTLGPHSNQTFFFEARPILIRKDINILDLMRTSAIGVPSGKGKLYFNINYRYNNGSSSSSSSKGESCPFKILLVSSYITLYLGAILGGALGSFLKILTIEKDLKISLSRNEISKWRPLIWGVGAALLAILIQPLGEVPNFQEAILLGATIGYLGSSVLEDIIARR